MLPVAPTKLTAMNIFNAAVISEFFKEHYLLFLLSIFTGTFAVTWYMIPKVIWVTREKDLTKPVIARSAHDSPVPTFGGVAFFVTLVLTLALVQAMRLSEVTGHLIAALTILFMVGIKDDLVVSTAKVKLLGQFTGIAFLIFSPELQLTSLHGFLGVHEISPLLGLPLAAFLLLAVVNSFNLIDGIDGLAGITGIVIGGIFATVFYFTGNHFYVLMSLTLMGTMAGFLRFNFSRGRRKIFMGDSGALIIGLLIGFLSLRVLSLDATGIASSGFLGENRLLFVLGVLFIPFFDTTRSILIRLMNGKSPFEADRNHTHHVLIDAGCSHKQASSILGVFNIFMAGIILVFANSFGSVGTTLAVLALFGLNCWGFDMLKKRSLQQQALAQEAAEKRKAFPSMPEEVQGIKIDRKPKPSENTKVKQQAEAVGY